MVNGVFVMSRVVSCCVYCLSTNDLYLTAARRYLCASMSGLVWAWDLGWDRDGLV